MRVPQTDLVVATNELRRLERAVSCDDEQRFNSYDIAMLISVAKKWSQDTTRMSQATHGQVLDIHVVDSTWNVTSLACTRRRRKVGRKKKIVRFKDRDHVKQEETSRRAKKWWSIWPQGGYTHWYNAHAPRKVSVILCGARKHQLHITKINSEYEKGDSEGEQIRKQTTDGWIERWLEPQKMRRKITWASIE